MLQLLLLVGSFITGNCINFTCHDSSQLDVCLPKAYDSFSLPPSQTPIIVDIRPDFEMVHGIDLLEKTVTFSVFFNVEWKDDRLVLGQEFKPDQMLAVDASLIKQAWIPNVFIYDLKLFEVSQVLAPQSGVWVSNRKYILYSQSVKIKIMCQMDFAKFPFDTQVCQLRVGSYSYNDSAMKFVSSHFSKESMYTRSNEDLDYVIKDLPEEDRTLYFGKLGNFSVTGFEMTISRNPVPYIFSFFIPTAICVLVSVMGLIVPGQDLLTRIMISLVPLVTIMVLNITLLTSLPRAPYTALYSWILAILVLTIIPLARTCLMMGWKRFSM